MNKTFSQWLINMLNDRDWSQAELARRAGLSRTAISDVISENRDENKTRATIRGLVSRVIARRTDDQITGVMYCNQVNGQVPPWGSEAKTLFEIVIPIRRYRAPAYPK